VREATDEEAQAGSVGEQLLSVADSSGTPPGDGALH
jgi:hypothetical protein